MWAITTRVFAEAGHQTGSKAPGDRHRGNKSRGQQYGFAVKGWALRHEASGLRAAQQRIVGRAFYMRGDLAKELL